VTLVASLSPGEHIGRFVPASALAGHMRCWRAPACRIPDLGRAGRTFRAAWTRRSQHPWGV